jgi:hypothetical protein
MKLITPHHNTHPTIITSATFFGSSHHGGDLSFDVDLQVGGVAWGVCFSLLLLVCVGSVWFGGI